MVLKDVRRDGNQTGHIFSRRARPGPDVGQMRCLVWLRPVPQKEDVNPSERFQLLYVARQPFLKIVGIRLHGSEALYLAEKIWSEQPLEVAHKTEAVIHAHRRERVLREDVKAGEQIVYLAPLCLFADETMQSLRPAPAEQDDDQIALFIARRNLYLLKHGMPDSPFRLDHVRADLPSDERGESFFSLRFSVAQPDVMACFTTPD